MEMIVSLVVDLITDPIKQYVVTPIKQHVSYAFTCDSKVQKLHHEVEQLQNKRVRLQQSVDEASSNGEEIYPNVTDWLTTAEKDIEEAEKLIQGKQEAKQKCCAGFCPNLKTRYHLSKKADKKALAMDEQLQSAEKLDPIAFRPPPQPIVERSMYNREALPSRILILNHIMDALKDQNLKTIGVYGMGGVKTTLAKEVLGQAAEQKLFETVVLVAVSETPDLRRIQGEIADALGMKFHAEEVPGRASQLHQRLNTAKVLIILDDIWQKLDLNAIGIPSKDASQGCKILLTSRKKDVLRSEMRTQTEFPLDVLEEEETLRLFEKSVSMGDDPELHALANEVANKCAGLPLLILKVATDLRNKDSYAWKDMLAQLSSSENTEIYEKVHKVIESSYEKMIDEEAKSLFLLCPLFGSSNIRIHDLLIYCMGLGLFKRMNSIEGSRNRVLTLIGKLKNESLLLDGDKAGFVKIHDVVRDIAATIASKEHCAFVGKGEIKSTDLERKYCRRISLPYCGIPALLEVLQCLEAEVFSLFAEDLSLHIPDSFFKGVTKLKVLHLIGVSFFPALPSSLGFLTGLQTLSLDGCTLVNVDMVAELKQLKVLSFAGSNVEELPREIESLTELKLLDLTGCIHLQVIPSYVLSNLCSLEELYMFRSFHEWDTEGNASLLELKSLRNLKTLEIRVKDDKLLPEGWFFNGIQNYKIIIGSWYHSDAMESSKMLMLELKTSVGLMGRRIKEFIGGAEVLQLHEMNGIENLLCDSSIEKINSFERLRFLSIGNYNMLELVPFSSEKCLPHLEEMEVHSCDNMEAIVGEGNEDEEMELTQLTSLKLRHLPNLRGISRRSGTVSFPNLTKLEIFYCNSLKYVFTTSMVKSIQKLKKIEIWGCESIEEIILVTEGIEEEDDINMTVFPELDFLRLHELPNLKRFSSGYPIEFLKLRELEITTCCEIKEYLFNDVVIPNVEVLELDRHSLKAITQSDDKGFSVESLQKLKAVTLVDLEEESVPILLDFLRQIHSVEKLTFKDTCLGERLPLLDGRAVGDQEQQFHLRVKHLHLVRVSKLKHIVEEDSQLNPILQSLQTLSVSGCNDMMNIAPSSVSFIKLTTLHVLDCDKMTSLVTASTAKRMTQLSELKVFNCKMMEDIIVANGEGDCREEHNDVITFNNLKHLTLYLLRTLNSFCSGNYIFNFPLLEQVYISGCYEIKNFCGGAVRTPKLKCEENLNVLLVKQKGLVEIPKRGARGSW